MKMVRVDMTVYYEAQDSTTIEEVNDVVRELAEMGGLDIKYSKPQLVWEKPDEEGEQ